MEREHEFVIIFIVLSFLFISTQMQHNTIFREEYTAVSLFLPLLSVSTHRGRTVAPTYMDSFVLV